MKIKLLYVLDQGFYVAPDKKAQAALAGYRRSDSAPRTLVTLSTEQVESREIGGFLDYLMREGYVVTLDSIETIDGVRHGI